MSIVGKFIGPDKVDTRKAFYGRTAIVGGIAVVAQAFHLISADQAANIGELLDALGTTVRTLLVSASNPVVSAPNSVASSTVATTCSRRSSPATTRCASSRKRSSGPSYR